MIKFESLARAFSALAIVSLSACASLPSTGTSAASTPAAHVADTVMAATAHPAGTMMYNVRAFGAAGDGVKIDSDAINRAIDAAAANGGGTVYFPAGFYLCYSIRLKTNITLYLDQGSWIVAADTPGAGALYPSASELAAMNTDLRDRLSTDAGAKAILDKYPMWSLLTAGGNGGGGQGNGGGAAMAAAAAAYATAPYGNATTGYDIAEPNIWGDEYQYQDFGHSHWHNSLIWGENITNVSILGPGIIFGRGLSRGDNYGNLHGANKSISLKNCRNVILKDFTILQGGWFGLLATGVDNLTLNNIKVDTNRDGFDIDACKNVRVSDCFVNSPQDDGICLKSSFGLGYARPTENVTITNCQVSGFVQGSFFNGTYDTGGRDPDGGGGPTGRIKFGTESNGGFKNITISNCVFDHCRGLALEAVDGGIIEDVTITNIAMRDVTNSPIYIRLGRRMRGPPETPIGAIRRVNINNVTVRNANPYFCMLILGTVGRPVEDVRLSDIRIVYDGGGTAQDAQLVPPEDEAMGYPEPGRMGTMPAYALFARHINGMTLRNVEVSYASPEQRPAVVLDDVANIKFDEFTAQRTADLPAFMMWNVRNFSVKDSAGIPTAQFPLVEAGMYPPPVAPAAPAVSAN